MRGFNTAASYPQYVKDFSGTARNRTEFLQIIHGFFKYLILLIFDGKQVELPGSCGVMWVRGRKIIPKLDEQGNIIGLSPNWFATKQLRESNPQANAEKKIVYHTNEHTNGIRYAFRWSKKNVHAENKQMWSFRLTKPNKVTLKNLIKANKEYIVESF